MPNAIEQIYNQITQVMGGTDPNQVLSMVMPGTALDAKLYAYDTSKIKPATVQEAESRLVDQMFDIAKVSASNNGQRVSSQFMQALSVLTPSFNAAMPLVKETIRDFINAQMPANTLLDGLPFVGTFQQYYFKLYDNYIATKLAWEKLIITQKNKFSIDPDTETEKYLEWYEEVAEGELLKVDEALGKVLAVFSPADMDALLGALAAGPGGEVYEASNTVKDAQLASPDGGFFYPVDLTPADWFLDLASDMDPANLLQDPEFIADTISVKRQAVMSSINQVSAMLANMPTQGSIKAAADKLTLAQTAYTSAQNSLLNTYTANTATAVEMYLSKHPKADQDSPTALTELTADANSVATAKGDKTNPGVQNKQGTALTAADVQALVAGQQQLITAQSGLQTSSQAVADAGLNLASEQASYFGDLPLILARLQSQLADLNNLQNDLRIASSATPQVPAVGPAPTTAQPAQASPSTASPRFMEVQMSFSSSDMEASASTDTSFSQTSWSVDLFFGSASGSSSSSSAVTSKNSIDSSTEIKVAFKAAKVDIQRDWLDPGVFKLSDEMNRISNEAISTPVTTTDADGNTIIDWSKAAQMNAGVFPAFPVAFLVVKDVNITFQAATSSLSAVQTVLDSKSAVGGGFLCFSASSSSASHSDHSSTSVKSTGNVINIAMPGPQILGWYLELPPKDNSTVLTAADAGTAATDLNIIQFVKKLASLKGLLNAPSPVTTF